MNENAQFLVEVKENVWINAYRITYVEEHHTGDYMKIGMAHDPPYNVIVSKAAFREKLTPFIK